LSSTNQFSDYIVLFFYENSVKSIYKKISIGTQSDILSFVDYI